MRHGLRLLTGAALAGAMFAGDAATLSLMPAAALAQAHGHGGSGHGGSRGGGFGGGGFHGGEHGGEHGGRGYDGGRGGYRGFGGDGGYRGYGGYGYGGYGGFGVGDALLGAALIGGTAAIIASSNQPVYEAPAYPVYQTYPPAYAAAPGDAPGGAAMSASADPVAQCSQTAEREAAAHGDSGQVVSIDHVDGYANGARVTGTLEITRGDRNAALERARFTCTADYGQVTAFRFG